MVPSRVGNGSVASITNNVDTGRTQNFTYDPLNRIGSAMSWAGAGADCWGQGFTIDTVANLTGISSQQCSSGTLSVTVDPATNHITTTGFSYDGAGNMTADGSGYTYTFDAENRLTNATGMSGGPWTYVYGGYGLRVEKSNAAGRFEITRAQFAAFDKRYSYPPSTDNYPANGVTFE
jgi:YD repeat-containing protein